jgi:hypothetical protein
MFRSAAQIGTKFWMAVLNDMSALVQVIFGLRGKRVERLYDRNQLSLGISRLCTFFG